MAAAVTVQWTPAAEYSDIRYELSGDGIAKITINRPEVRNAFRPQTLVEVSDAMERARELDNLKASLLAVNEKLSLLQNGGAAHQHPDPLAIARRNRILDRRAQAVGRMRIIDIDRRTAGADRRAFEAAAHRLQPRQRIEPHDVDQHARRGGHLPDAVETETAGLGEKHGQRTAERFEVLPVFAELLDDLLELLAVLPAVDRLDRGADQLERHIHRPGVVTGVVDTPVWRLVRHVLGLHEVLTSDLDRVEANIARVQKLCDAAGVANRPHIKTHKSPVLAKMQLAAGAKGITCQKLGEAEVMAEAGLDDILITYNIIGATIFPHNVGLGATRDVALIETDGEDVVKRGASRTFVYSEEQRQFLRRALEEAKVITARDDRHGVLGEAFFGMIRIVVRLAPLGALAEVDGDEVRLRAAFETPTGTLHRADERGSAAEIEALVARVAAQVAPLVVSA